MRSMLAIVLAAYAVFVGWFTHSLNTAGESMAAAQALLTRPPAVPAHIVRFDGVQRGLVVPSWYWLDVNRPWAYAGPRWALASDFTPSLTVITEIKIGAWVGDKRLHPLVLRDVKLMTAAAETAGHPLIITSAYRSYVDQSSLRAASTVLNGQSYTDQYVAQPGHSEHQLGLAVDFSSYTKACELAFASCALSARAANWLAEHAHEYGFIVRYPEGKQHITGVAPEAWHFRYVGHKMAALIKQSGLTFDEVHQQLEVARRKFVENS